MKRTILYALAVLVGLCNYANDRFYIEDFTINPGETLTVSIMLDNETAYTAFQTDIYLPEGLTVEQEDGYYIFDLTSRKGRDHNISSQLQADGAIRIMSYSPSIKTYSGNSGALVTFNVVASSDFEAPASILLKNILFTTVAGIEVPFDDETCTVTQTSTALRGDVDGNGLVNISDVTALIDYLLSGNAQLINEENADVDHDGAISISDVTALIDFLLIGHWPEPEPTPGITSYTVNGVTFNMVEVEGGTFQMGATVEQEENANDNEKPVHQVTLSGFNLGQTEVTQELWQAVMGTNPSKFNDNVNKPVENISWEDCQTFIATLNELTGQNFRLPTEAEWEFAARGGMKSQGYKYSGSDDLNEIAWYNYNAYAVGSSSPDYGTHAAATKAANELGLHDMTGNVWEWCQDWSGDYSAADQINPTGPETGTNRVIRGGGWTNYPSLLRVAARSGYKPGFIGNFIGFRLAL